jgi:hypothetical protein
MHIGEKIKNRAKDLRLGPTELAKIINTSKQNIYGIYKRNSVDSDLLFELSKALDTDFFAIYSTNLVQGQEGNSNSDYQTIGSDLVSVKKELSDLKEKYVLLKALYEVKTGESIGV